MSGKVHPGKPMVLRLKLLPLVVLTLGAMYFALETLGQDNGQLRPGLAQAAAEGRLEEVWAEARAREVASSDAEGAFVEAEPVPEPILPEPILPAAPAASVALAEPIEADLVVEPEPEVAVADPVFTLELFGNEPVPGEAEARAEGSVEPEPVLLTETETAPEPETEPEVADADQGRVWYVLADSVNVRAEPSTEAAILGKLTSGESLLMIAAVDDEWARIVIEGDGIEGYVASRFLSPVAP
jgi:uncharacterized protein YgiM (DUF1202 family)